MAKSKSAMREGQGSEPVSTPIHVTGGTSVSKSGFAGIIGVSPGRVTQMIAAGLPVEANGKINVARGRDWYHQNVDGRAQPPRNLFETAGPSAKEERDFHDARLRKMKADQLAGDLVDRATAERVVFGRARADRDAWLAWPVDAAAALAAELAIDEAALLPALTRLVHRHLTELADRKHADLG